jgi:cytochrome c oxidase cbb3-type subunit 3
MTDFWSIWISVITIAVMLGCLLLVVGTRKSEVHKETTTEILKHSFDGVEELDNPLPRWWFNMFILTIVFGVVYLFLYPGLGNYKGYLNWTSYNQWEEEMAYAEKHYQPVFSRYAQLSVEQISNDEKAGQIGQRMFANNCALCHGQGGVGAFGFPNLTDSDWLYGGAGDVMSISGQTADPKLAAKGKVTFQSTCVACHGADAKGNLTLGAPNLTDNTWLYGGSFEKVSHTIRQGRGGMMPAHKNLLNQDKIHLIAGYVYGLSR